VAETVSIQGFPFHFRGLWVEGVFAKRRAAVRNGSHSSATVCVKSLWPCLWQVFRKWFPLALSICQTSCDLVSCGGHGTS